MFLFYACECILCHTNSSFPSIWKLLECNHCTKYTLPISMYGRDNFFVLSKGWLREGMDKELWIKLKWTSKNRWQSLKARINTSHEANGRKAIFSYHVAVILKKCGCVMNGFLWRGAPSSNVMECLPGHQYSGYWLPSEAVIHLICQNIGIFRCAIWYHHNHPPYPHHHY